MRRKSTLVLGASLNPSRYSNKAIRQLRSFDYEVFAVGGTAGTVADVPILDHPFPFKAIHTISLYLSPKRQIDYYHYILDLKPQRVIFNPGTENEVLFQLLTEQEIPYEASCTLVLLATNQYEP